MGKVERYLLERIRSEGAIHITLIDPEEQSPTSAERMAKAAEAGETAAIMVGGSTVVSTIQVNEVVKAIKQQVEIPVIIFPNNVSSVSPFADAIWFMSLLNSSDPYYLIKAQVLGAPLVKRYKLEAIPLGYIVLGQDTSVSFIGDVRPISHHRPDLVSAYALAAQYLGMRFVYLEAGSGSKQPVPTPVIKVVKDCVDIPVIVGGGIRDPDQARECAIAGATIIVTGTLVEQVAVEKIEETIGRIVKGIRLE
ncbi:MAG: geranylgeranylglyceryl/heptaprenylglyceryl phosphate synthase [Candidatus Bathyarchaeia archaeon]